MIAIIIAGIAIALIIFEPWHWNVQGKTIDVNGNAELEKQADIATVYLGYQNLNNNAQEAEKENANTIAKIKSAIMAKGVSENKIETDSYYLNQEYEWTQNGQVFKGYRAYHRLKINLENFDNVGSVITAAVSSGANFVDSIQYSLSDEELNALKAQALQEASKNAREKADSIAQGLGLKIKGIKSVQDTSYDYRPWLYDVAYKAESIGGSGGTIKTPASVEIGKVKVTASVHVIFDIA